MTMWITASPCALVHPRWYHDEITSGFHMVVNITGETYGFWDLGIIGAAGRTTLGSQYSIFTPEQCDLSFFSCCVLLSCRTEYCRCRPSSLSNHPPPPPATRCPFFVFPPPIGLNRSTPCVRHRQHGVRGGLQGGRVPVLRGRSAAGLYAVRRGRHLQGFGLGRQRRSQGTPPLPPAFPLGLGFVVVLCAAACERSLPTMHPVESLVLRRSKLLSRRTPYPSGPCGAYEALTE